MQFSLISIYRLISSKDGYRINLFCSIFFDNIWRIRNQMIFANYKPDPKKDATIKMLLYGLFGWRGEGGEVEGSKVV